MASREDQGYETAALEVASKSLAPSAWGRAISEALGDSQLALALYIKFRVQQLEREYREANRLSQCDHCKTQVRPKEVRRDFLHAVLSGKPEHYFVCPKCGQEVKAAIDQ